MSKWRHIFFIQMKQYQEPHNQTQSKHICLKWSLPFSKEQSGAVGLKVLLVML